MAISVTDPITQAIDRAKLITFRPFDIGKWFTLGFCAFLASLGQGGANFNFNLPGGGGRPGPGRSAATQPADVFNDITSWISAHVLETTLIALVVALLAVAIGLVLLWLSSRGTFMFTEGIAKNTAEVSGPLKRYRRLGNSLFGFHVCLAAVSLAVFLVIIGIALLLAWHDIQAPTFGSGAIAALIVGSLLLIPTAMVFGLIGWCVDMFVTTIMYARDATVVAAWGEFRQKILAGNVGSVLLFLLMSILLSIAVGIGQMLLGCLTLCVGFLPYLSSVVALPLLVFKRSYAIYFLQQFGPEYVIMSEPPRLDYGFPVVMPPRPPPPV